MKKYFLFLCCLSLSILACNSDTAKQENSAEQNTESETVKEEVPIWINLFDGKSLDGWRGYNEEGIPENWQLKDGILESKSEEGISRTTIVFGDQQFENFELEWTWKISEGGNSGMFYHIVEGEDFKWAYENAPEYQLIDDLGYPDPLEDWQAVGADYGMYGADAASKVIKPAGEWNQSKIRFTPEGVEHWLNDKKVVEFVPWSEEWNAKIDAGKWKDFPAYGKAKTGYIGMQDHGHPIYFKSIRIRTL